MDIDWDDVMVLMMRWPNFAVYWERYWPQKETASDSELSGGEIYGENEPLATAAGKKDKAHAQKQVEESNETSRVKTNEDGGGEAPEETEPAAKWPCGGTADPHGEYSKPAPPSVTRRLARVAHQQQHLAVKLGEMQDRHQEQQVSRQEIICLHQSP